MNVILNSFIIYIVKEIIKNFFKISLGLLKPRVNKLMLYTGDGYATDDLLDLELIHNLLYGFVCHFSVILNYFKSSSRCN